LDGPLIGLKIERVLDGDGGSLGPGGERPVIGQVVLSEVKLNSDCLSFASGEGVRLELRAREGEALELAIRGGRDNTVQLLLFVIHSLSASLRLGTVVIQVRCDVDSLCDI